VVPFWGVPALTDDDVARAALRERLGDASHGFLVLARAWEIDPGDRLAGQLAAEAAIVAQASFPGVRVLEWRRPGGAPETGP